MAVALGLVGSALLTSCGGPNASARGGALQGARGYSCEELAAGRVDAFPSGPQFVVESVGDEQFGRRVNGDRLAVAVERTSRQIDGRVRRAFAVSGEPAEAVACDGGDDAVDFDPADAIVEGVGDQESVLGIDDDTLGALELGRSARPAVAQVAEIAGARDGSDGARGTELADPVVAAVRDQQTAAKSDRDPGRRVESRVRGRPVVTREARLARPRHRRDDPRSVNTADTAARGVSDEDAALAATLGPGARISS